MGRFFGRHDGETTEQHTRRLTRFTVTEGALLPSIVELYDRVAALEAQVAELAERGPVDRD